MLDDPLAALDAATASHVLEQCIHGLLASSGVLLTTHSATVASSCHHVILVQSGKCQQVSQNSTELSTLSDKVTNSTDADAAAGNDPLRSEDKARPTELVKAEDKTAGAVTFETYGAYGEWLYAVPAD